MKVVVIGAGPSGLVVASECAKNGHNVILLDKNEKVGKKLYITGKGRCNVTNNCDCLSFLNNVVNNSKFLYGSIFAFTPQDTVELFENNGCKLKTERGNRVFPISDKSSDIIKTLKDECSKNNVQILLNEEVIDCYKNNELFYVKTKNSNYTSDALVICTGGMSYKATGSNGFGYKLAKKFGHTIISPVPALCPIQLKDTWVKSIEGLSLKNVQLCAYSNNKLVRTEFGEMLFTKNGISGPIALTISSYINRLQNVSLSLDFKPALTNEKLENRLLREFDANKNSQISSVIKNLLPRNLVPIFLKQCKIDETKKCNSITIEERRTIVTHLKNFVLNFDRLYDIDYAIITSGGVSTKEINPKTMESKIVPNLFFAGEILDVDALTGGFNIQIAISTAMSASKGVR